MPISVVLVDDHAVVRDGLRALLESQVDLRVVASFSDARAAVGFCTDAAADVVILDIALPDMNGIEAAKQLHDHCPEAKVLMLSMHSSAEFVHRALRGGASGYVLKESAGAEVIEAVRTVHAGGRFISRKLLPQALEDYARRHADEPPLERLSPRERQVLKLVVEGRTSNEIAQGLGVSSKSIDTYRHRMMLKLGIDDLPGLVKFAIRHGITSVE
ncbi:MAG TPA: response regulator transcription factor [Burkholderiales bacterium]|nr:response regulator transcription factor [Burkholderiales bacterium]